MPTLYYVTCGRFLTLSSFIYNEKNSSDIIQIFRITIQRDKISGNSVEHNYSFVKRPGRSRKHIYKAVLKA